MADSGVLNCPHCDTRYKNRGWLTKHIAKYHEDALQLEKDMTWLQTNAQDISQKEAGLNLSENPFWESTEMIDPNVLTPTPSGPQTIPLCLKANNFIVEKGKTLPASLLATLLPAPGFVEDLNRSLKEQHNVDVLLERFEQEVRYLKCKNFDFSCLGNVKLRKHIESHHPQVSKPSGPDPALLSLGDYLASLESKIEHCRDLILKQSTQTSEQTVLIKKLLTQHIDGSAEKEDDVIPYFKCHQCQFETESRRTLISHIQKKHNEDRHQDVRRWEVPYSCDECGQVFNSEAKFNDHRSAKHSRKTFECPMCAYNNSSEVEVTMHVQYSHPEYMTYSCDKCGQVFNSEACINDHRSAMHAVMEFECPMCDYKNSSEVEVTKHVQYSHPENHACGKCTRHFNSESELRGHTAEEHNAQRILNKYKCEKCQKECNGTSELKSHTKVEHPYCDKCKKDFNTKSDLQNHVSEAHVSKAKFKNTLLLGDSNTKFQNPRLIEKALGGRGLYTPGFVRPRTDRAYCSTRDWPNSRYPENNLEDKVMEQLSVRDHSHVIFGAPCNDITNIGDIQDKSEKYKLAIKSSENCINIAEKALERFPTLEKVIIPERLPRADHLSELSEFSNFALKSLAENSNLSTRIIIAPMDSMYFTNEKKISM